MFTEQTSVHRIRFYVPDNLKGIQSMSIDCESKKIAVARRGIDESTAHSSVIEIWNIQHSPFVEQTIHESDTEPSSIEAVCWGPDGRLFSCGCDGYINEYDLLNSCFKRRHDLSGSPVWCLTMNPDKTKLVCGSESGKISIVDLVEDGFGEVHTLGKMSSRVLSLVWMTSCDKIVAGSQGIISIYDHGSKKLLEKIELDSNTLIWSLAAYDDTIISGDSKGYTSFWSATTATLGQNYKSHKSDVLCVHVSPYGLVYSSGIDPEIAQFDVFALKPLIPIHIHTHDVRAIVVDDDGHIYSGGQDVNLVKTIIIQPKSTSKFSPDLSDCIKFWDGILAIQYLKNIDLFNLDSKNLENSAKENPVKVASIKSKHNIIASAINSNWVVYGGYKDIVFVNSVNDLVKVRHSLSISGLVNKMSFLDRDTLALCTSAQLHVIDLSKGEVREVAVRQFDHRITTLATCSESIAISLSSCELIYIPRKGWKPISVSNLLSIPTAMSFNPFEKNKLYICTVSKNVFKFNLEPLNLKEDTSTELKKLEADQYFRSIAFTSKSVLINTTTGLYSFDNSFSFKTRVSNYKRIIAMKSFLDHQIVLVELPDEEFIKLLPAAFMKRIYGAE